MRKRFLSWALVSFGMCLVLAASAQDKPAATPAAKSGEVPKDKDGIKGISPFWEAVKAGDNAYLARDFEGALGHYQKAVTASPQDAVGHLRMAEVQLKLDQLKPAEESLVAAVRFVGENWKVRAKAFFLLSVLRERQTSMEGAVESWQAYQKLGEQHPESKVHAETPPERIRRIKEAAELKKQYAAVKERIKERLEEAEAKARKQ